MNNSSRRWSRWRPHVAVVAAYLALTVLTLGPLQPFREVWGGSTDDFFEHVQLLWWQADQAAQGHPFPLFTTDLAYPDGGKMFLPDPIGGTTAILFVWLFGTAFAYNLLMAANFVFAGWAMFWLVRRRTRDDWAAALSGVLYMLSPVMLGNLNNGITEIMQAGWLPLFVGLLLELLDTAAEPSPGDSPARAVFRTGLAMALVALGQWYYGIYACLLFGLIVPARAGLRWRSWAYAAAALAVFAALIAPVAAVFALTFRGGDSLFYLGNMDFYITQQPLLFAHSADPAFLFAARPAFDNYLHLGYIGFVTPLLLLVGLARRQWRAAAWLSAALFFVVLAFGPVLQWRGEAVGDTIRLPYYLLYKIVPFFKEMRLPYRFFIVVHLCLAAAVGVGLRGWLSDRRLRGVVFVVAASLFWLETAWLSGAPVPAERQDVTAPAGLAQLGRDPAAGAVLDVPIQFGPGARGRYLVAQTAHGRPLVYGIQGRDFAPTLRGNLAVNVLFEAGRRRVALAAGPDLFRGHKYSSACLLADCLPDTDACPGWIRSELRQSVTDLAGHGVRFVVLHQDLVQGNETAAVMTAMFGDAWYQDAEVIVFRLDAPPADG